MDDSQEKPHLRGEVARRPYRTAGLVYGVLGVAILGLTALDPQLLQPERRADLVHLWIGLPFFAVFALAIAFGDTLFATPLRFLGLRPPRAERAGRRLQQGLTMLLTLSAAARTVVFLGNGLGRRLRLGGDQGILGWEMVASQPRMLVNAVLMATICGFLFRAAWWPLLRRAT